MRTCVCGDVVVLRSGWEGWDSEEVYVASTCVKCKPSGMNLQKHDRVEVKVKVKTKPK